MSSVATIHVLPAAGGGWLVQALGSGPSSTHPSQSLAVAKAWELSKERTSVEVIVHGPDGAILSIRRVEKFQPDQPEIFDPTEDEALRREAERIAPRRAELDSLIDRLRPSSINYDEEDDELPC